MAIQVAGSAGFQGAVIDALSEICTCRPVKSDVGTIVLGTSDDPCCCGSPLGCSLVENVMEDCEGDVTIAAFCKSSYDPTKYEINFCTDPTETALDCDGKRSPVSISLAHELIHAWLHCLNEPERPYWDEEIVVCGENEIRKEMGVTPRCAYGGTTISKDCGWLPNDWQIPPECQNSLQYWFCLILTVVKKLGYEIKASAKSAQRRWSGDMRPTPAPGGEDEELWDWSTKPTLEKRVAQAEWVREREPAAARIDELIAELEVGPPGSRPILLLESITIDHPYAVALIYEKEGVVEVVSNRRSGRALTRYSFGSDTFRRHPQLGELWDRVTFPAGPPPAFGDPAITDGTVQFLELRTGGRVDRRTAMYGFYFPAQNPGVSPPSDPQARERWDAVVAFDELLAAIMDLEPASVEWVD